MNNWVYSRMISCETFETDENIFISYTDLLSQLVSNTHFFFFASLLQKLFLTRIDVKPVNVLLLYLKGWECSTKGRCFQGDVNGNHCLWSVALPNLFDSLHDYNFENIYFIVIYNISVTSSIGEHGKCHDGLLSTMRFSQQ